MLRQHSKALKYNVEIQKMEMPIIIILIILKIEIRIMVLIMEIFKDFQKYYENWWFD